MFQQAFHPIQINNGDIDCWFPSVTAREKLSFINLSWYMRSCTSEIKRDLMCFRGIFTVAHTAVPQHAHTYNLAQSIYSLGDFRKATCRKKATEWKLAHSCQEDRDTSTDIPLCQTGTRPAGL